MMNVPRTVLVVGGAGYIGSHMVATLLEAGHVPLVLDNFSTGHRDLLAPGVVHYEGRCGDGPLLARIFSEHKVDAVMHFAASSLVGESVTDPINYYRNNVSQTIELLAAMVEHGVKRFILSSTAAVYGEPVQVPIDETHPTQPTNPYGTTKAALERLLAELAYAHALQYVSLRYFNAAGAHPNGRIGERHDPETHLIPILLQVALGQRKQAQVYGLDWPTPDGSCIRDYVHVCDLASAHLAAVQALFAGAPNAIYNLGTGQGCSVLEVLESVRRITGHPIPVVVSKRRAGDPAVLVASADKIQRELGWTPRYAAIDDIVGSAWRWHRGFWR
ncbi:MAG: UDP-glucose 4-epimerase GalE [Pseudomonadota bacterium]